MRHSWRSKLSILHTYPVRTHPYLHIRSIHRYICTQAHTHISTHDFFVCAYIFACTADGCCLKSTFWSVFPCSFLFVEFCFQHHILTARLCAWVRCPVASGPPGIPGQSTNIRQKHSETHRFFMVFHCRATLIICNLAISSYI